RQLQPEALVEIFAWCLFTTNSEHPVRSLKTEVPPMTLTVICQNWRRIAINVPRLWTSLHIHLPPHLSDDIFSPRTAGVSLWLEHSGSLPLSIS
ncbi:hypothetical protein BT96DRAFT_765351, partial [Gymnopus androsaceus JB14]